MRALGNIDVAFIPMNLPYTISSGRKKDAVRAFRARSLSVSLPQERRRGHAKALDGSASMYDCGTGTTEQPSATTETRISLSEPGGQGLSLNRAKQFHWPRFASLFVYAADLKNCGGQDVAACGARFRTAVPDEGVWISSRPSRG